MGPETAAKVVGKRQRDKMEFYREILKAKREYARTKDSGDEYQSRSIIEGPFFCGKN